MSESKPVPTLAELVSEQFQRIEADITATAADLENTKRRAAALGNGLVELRAERERYLAAISAAASSVAPAVPESQPES